MPESATTVGKRGFMAHMVWTNDLNTGIDVIDGQHKRIVEHINQLHDARQRHDKTAVGEVIEATIDYMLSHFAFEEALMEDAEYEFVRPHKQVHEFFAMRMTDFQTRFRAGEDVSEELQNFLNRWLVTHIRNDDAGYASAVKSRMRALGQQKQKRGWFSRAIEKFFRRG